MTSSDMPAVLPGDLNEINAILDGVEANISSSLDLPAEDWLGQSGPFKSLDEFQTSSIKSMRELLRYTNVKPSSRVLDYGCGLARLALPFSGYLDAAAGGRYTGIDTDASCIDRNAKVFGSLDHFRFDHVNLFSTMYNRGGKKSYRSIKRKKFGGPFDLAFLFSVFTHILPEDCDDLLNFLNRRLVPGGEVFCSWFLLNPETEDRISRGTSHRPFPYTHGSVRIDNAEIPEGAVAYQEAEVRERLARAGFSNVQIHYGKWRGDIDSWVWQDIVTATAG